MQGMAPELGMLKGLALQEAAGSSRLVKLFDVRQLPSEPAARFKAVFQERLQWAWQDLQPYVEDLQARRAGLPVITCMLCTPSDAEQIRLLSGVQLTG